jgi:hypothetical protein
MFKHLEESYEENFGFGFNCNADSNGNDGMEH